MRIVFVENKKNGKVHPSQLPDGRVPGEDTFRRLAVASAKELAEGLDDADLVDLYWSLGFSEETPTDRMAAAEAIWKEAKKTQAVYRELPQATGDDDMAGSKKGAKKAATPKKPREKKAAAEGSGVAGRPSAYSGMKLYIKTEGKKNPRREGTHGYNSFALIKDGMTYEAFIEHGGRPNDLRWDVDRGNIEVR